MRIIKGRTVSIGTTADEITVIVRTKEGVESYISTEQSKIDEIYTQALNVDDEDFFELSVAVDSSNNLQSIEFGTHN